MGDRLGSARRCLLMSILLSPRDVRLGSCVTSMGSVEDTCKNRSQGLRLVAEIETLAASTDLSIRQIQETIAGKASRGSIGEIVKRTRPFQPSGAFDEDARSRRTECAGVPIVHDGGLPLDVLRATVRAPAKVAIW